MEIPDTNHSAPAAIPALVTPFDKLGSIAIDKHGANVAMLAARGVAGFLVAGSTGEGPYLVAGERRRLLESARVAAPASYLICGIAAQSVVQAREQIEELGSANAALVVTPTMFVADNADQIRFFTEVADSAPLPIWLYTVPGVTGYNLPTEAVAILSSHPNITGIKDSSGIAERIGEMRRSCSDEFMIYAGASRVLATARRLGANGAITASANYAWELVDAVMSAKSDDDAMDTAQAKLTELSSAVETFGLRGTKFAAAMFGVEAGVPRLPISPLSSENATILTEAIAALA